MSKVGSLSEDVLGNKEELVGEIRTLKFRYEIALIPVKQKSGDKAPDYEIFTNVAEADRVRIGLAWKSTSKKTGKEYISIKIDDPSFPKPFQAAAFKNSDGGWDIAWKRQDAA